MENKQCNPYLIKVIKACIEGYNNCTEKGAQLSLKYIMGQAIRQYRIPSENWHVSKAAYDLWKRLTDENIKDFTYREVICVKEDDNEVGIYIGNEKDPSKKGVTKGSKIPYNSLFHDEHTIPVSRIVDELLNKDSQVTESEIETVLNGIHICKITKAEDRDVEKKYKREGTFEEIVKNVYGDKVSDLIPLE